MNSICNQCIDFFFGRSHNPVNIRAVNIKTGRFKEPDITDAVKILSQCLDIAEAEIIGHKISARSGHIVKFLCPAKAYGNAGITVFECDSDNIYLLKILL